MQKKEVVSKWDYPLSDEKIRSKINRLSIESGVSFIEACVLYNRGIDTVDEIVTFYSLTLNHLHNTMLMADADVATERLKQAILNGELIVNYSDYDADGWGSLVFFNRSAKNLGAKVEYFTNRRSMGFGISVEGIKMLMERFPETKLIITTDNGIVGFEAVEYANSIGVDIIITDHHEPHESGELPKALAVVDPHRKDCEYPFKGLCGAGVIFKLMMLLYYKLDRDPKECYQWLDIVATSTVGDVVNLVDENRIIVKEGLKLINKEEKNIWTTMRKVFSNDNNPITEVNSRTLGFSYVPAINACSRLLGSIDIPVELFLLDDDDVDNQEKIATKMKGINEERKEKSKDQTNGAYGIYATQEDGDTILVSHEEFHHGIVGIVAGQLKENFYRPTFILGSDEKDKNIFKGSARSIDGYPLKDVLDAIQARTGILLKYGGHKAAAGMSIHKDNMKQFKEELELEAKARLTKKDLIKKTVVDIALQDFEITPEVLDCIKNLEPFGNGFEEPIIGVRDFTAKDVFFMGTDKQHVKLVSDHLNIISWHGAEFYKTIGEPISNVSAIGRCEQSTFNNVTSMQLVALTPSDIRQKKQTKQ